MQSPQIANSNARPRLWLHVGPAKSGTKTIQKTFHAYKDALREIGCLYPQPPRRVRDGRAQFNHHTLARSLQDSYVEHARKYVASLPPARDTILSSEGFTKVQVEPLRLFAQSVEERYDVRVIYYVRHPVDRANSMAQQSIKAGNFSYAEVSKKRRVFPMRGQVMKFITAFGEDRIVLRKFSRSAFIGGDLISDFCHAIERPDLDEVMTERSTANESMTLETALNIDRHRARTGDRTLIRGDDPRFAEGSTKFTLPDSTIESIKAVSRADYEWLRERFGIEFPDLLEDTRVA